MTNDYINALKRKFLRARGTDDRHPVRDWHILLVVSGTMLLAILVWQWVVFDRVVNDKFGSVQTDSVGKSGGIKTPANELRELYKARSEEVEKYRTGAYLYPDPSQ